MSAETHPDIAPVHVAPFLRLVPTVREVEIRTGARHRHEPMHLPTPPTDEEKYSYFAVQRRWPFVWLFVSQAFLALAFTAVMIHSPATAMGLVLLTFVVPPMVVNLWLRMRTRRVGLEDHVVRVEDWRRGRTEFPSVDVFLPTCGEEPAVLDNTFRYVSQLDWPGTLRIHVLDDADDAETHRLAEKWGLHYVVRANRGEWKKAGNMINAFESTDGDYIAVYDADFAPRPDFLWETIPYMEEEKTGVVQTAQYFDVDARVNEFARFAGSLQELFFRWIQPARDTYEAAICAGTNVVYKRRAVVAAGGFARVPLGEDVHSGVKIWVANYRTRYLPLVLAKGLAPDTWEALTNQQYRWARSSMLLMVSAFFREAPFNWRQRICFWAAFLYYMASAAIILTATLPTLDHRVVLPAHHPSGPVRPDGAGHPRDGVRLPAAGARLATDHLPGLHDQHVLPPAGGHRRDARPGAGVGADGRRQEGDDQEEGEHPPEDGQDRPHVVRRHADAPLGRDRRRARRRGEPAQHVADHPAGDGPVRGARPRADHPQAGARPARLDGRGTRWRPEPSSRRRPSPGSRPERHADRRARSQ